MITIENWLRLTTMILCDALPNSPRPLYLFGETKDNQSSSLNRAIDEMEQNDMEDDMVLLCGGTLEGVYEPQSWIRHLQEYGGVQDDKIHLIPLEGPVNTKTEADALVRYLEAQGMTAVVIIAPPFHQLRCFLTVLGSLKTAKRLDIAVYNLVGFPLPWQEKCIHSQGILTEVRENLIATELKRINDYTAKGDLVTVEEALMYLRNRT